MRYCSTSVYGACISTMTHNQEYLSVNLMIQLEQVHGKNTAIEEEGGEVI
jgi:hypothetical protein